MATLEKPGVVSNHLGGSKVGLTGTSFFIKVLESNIDVSSPDSDVTGDGDSYPTFENNEMLYADIALRGAMIASQAIGLANIVDTTKNPPDLTLDLGANRRLAITALVRAIRINWNRKAAFVGVAMVLRATGTNPSNLEAAVA